MAWFVMLGIAMCAGIGIYSTWNIRVLMHGVADIVGILYADKVLRPRARKMAARIIEAIKGKPFDEDAAHAALVGVNTAMFRFERSVREKWMAHTFANLAESIVAQTIGAGVLSFMVAIVVAAVSAVVTGVLGALAGTITGTIHGNVVGYAELFGNVASACGGAFMFTVTLTACFIAVIIRVLDKRPMVTLGRWIAAVLAPALPVCLYAYRLCPNDVEELLQDEREDLSNAVQELRLMLANSDEENAATVRMRNDTTDLPTVVAIASAAAVRTLRMRSTTPVEEQTQLSNCA